MTPGLFRYLVIGFFGLVIASLFIHAVALNGLPVDLLDYVKAQDASQSTLLDVIALIFIGGFLASVYGLYQFRPWSRPLFLAVLVLSAVPLTGPVVMAPIDAFLNDMSSILAGALIALAYWSPVKNRFRAEPPAAPPSE
ncbi:MAG: hypothetical protein HY255_02590 [Betaproteobacteria bacterium]|nr:hypothetical protein [Betaproteobacteria bacterium]